MTKYKISFIHHTIDDEIFWGGDLKNMQSLCTGLKEIGHSAELTDRAEKALDADFVFLVNAGHNITSSYYYLKLMEKQYGVIGFYEDALLFHSPAWGLFYYIRAILEGQLDQGYPFSLERLLENPGLIHYYPTVPKKAFFRNYEVLNGANLYIAQCKTEAGCVRRDCPSSNIQILYPDRKIPDFCFSEVTDDFLQFAGVSKGGFILQVGRLELRKNQLATVIACRNMDVPLVFICTGNKEHKEKMETTIYDEVFLEAILKWRCAPTIVISQYMESYENGFLKVIQMPGGKKLSSSMMTSAFAHAGLYVHPAFYELPGLVYIEAMSYGVPTIASKWTALKEYFTDDAGNYHIDGRVEYCLPYDLGHLTELVEKKFGENYSRYDQHPLLQKNKADIAQDFVGIIEKNYQL